VVYPQDIPRLALGQPVTFWVTDVRRRDSGCHWSLQALWRILRLPPPVFLWQDYLPRTTVVLLFYITDFVFSTLR